MGKVLSDVGTLLHPGRLLDFGCGDGHFLEKTLRAAGIMLRSLDITVLDLVDEYRAKAAQCLAPWSRDPVQSWIELPKPHVEQFDRVVVNHVLYYVPDLAETLNALWALLLNDGKMYITMGHEQENAWAASWIGIFDAAGKPKPWHRSSEVRQRLEERGWSYHIQKVTSQLVFDDTAENRHSIGRLIFAEYLASLDPNVIDARFDLYAEAGMITMPLLDEIYCVEKS